MPPETLEVTYKANPDLLAVRCRARGSAAGKSVAAMANKKTLLV